MKKIQLSIPEPCHENWDAMTPSHQGRFCNACAKTVIDFSMMSDAEVLSHFSKRENENVCGRAYPDQLDRSLQAPPHKKFYWRWNYVVAFLLFFAKAGTAKAQGAIIKKELTIPGPGRIRIGGDTNYRVITAGKMINNLQVKKQKADAAKKIIRFAGIITNEQGHPIANATIMRSPGKSGVVTDENGCFQIDVNTATDQLLVSMAGYQERNISSFSTAVQTIVLQQRNEFLGEVVVTCSPLTGKGYMTTGLFATRRTTIIDTLKNAFVYSKPFINVYPNPAPKGGTVNLEMNLKRGLYSLQVLDVQGKVFVQKQITGVGAKMVEKIFIGGAWSSGTYFITITDNKRKVVAKSGLLIAD